MRRPITLKAWLRVLRWKTRENVHHFRRHLPWGGLALVLIAASLTSFFEHTRFLQSLKMANFDAYIASQDPSPSEDVVLVEIDDKDYDTFGRKSPLDQTPVMTLIEAIAAGGPKAIVIDLDTSHWNPQAVPAAWSSTLHRPQSEPPELIWARPVTRRAGQPELLGTVAGKRDVDLIDGSVCWAVPEVLEMGGVVRSYRALVPFGTGSVPSLASAAAIVFRSVEKRSNVRVGEPTAAPNCKQLSLLGKPLTDEALLKNGVVTFPTFTSSQLAEFQGFPFKNKLVVLGGTYPEARDSFGTAVGRRAGIDILATAIESELHRPMPLDPSGWKFFTVDIFFGLLLLLIGHLLPKVIGVPLVVLGVPAAAIAGSFLVFQSASYFFSFMPVLVGIFLHRVFDDWLEGVKTRGKDSGLRKDIANKRRRIRKLEYELAVLDDSRPTFSEKDSIDLSLRITRGRA